MVVEWMDPGKQHRKVRTHLMMALQPGQLLYGSMPGTPILPVPTSYAAGLLPAAGIHSVPRHHLEAQRFK
jgi:hypothetical protein